MNLLWATTCLSRWFNDKIGMTVSLVGRNLWMIYNKAPFDPEITASTGTYYPGARLFHAAQRPYHRFQRKTPILKFQTN